MQAMMRSSSRFFIGAVVAITLCGTGTAADAPMLVDVFANGDDVLTLTLAYAIEKALISSPDFVVRNQGMMEGAEGTVGILVVTIPTNVAWRERRGRTRIIYTVEFSTKDNNRVLKTHGCCWERSVKKCAKEVLQDAKLAAKRVL